MDDLDWEQCQQCLSGDASAFAGLMKRHEAEIARQMWRFTRDRAVQADLVQDVFVETYLSLRRYRPQKSPFVHWLRRIATRVGYRFWKCEARMRRQVPLGDFDRPVAAATILASSAAALLHDLLSRLRPADRLVLTLMYFEECSIDEIAGRTGWTKAMTKMRAMRARNRLRELIVKDHLGDALREMSDGSVGSH